VQDIVRHTTVGKKVDLPHRLTNTGNTASEYEVRVRHNLGDSGNLEPLKLFTDTNANGVTEPGEPEWAEISCDPLEVNVSCYKVGSLDPNEVHEFVVSGNTSTVAQTGDKFSMTIRAFPWKYDEILSNAPTCGVPVRAGQVITYQLGFSNIGGAAPLGKALTIDGIGYMGAVLEDVLPANLTLNKSSTPVATPNQSVVLVQKVEDEDTDRWVSFSEWNGTDVVSKIGLFVPTSQIQPNQSGNLDFSVTVNPNVTSSVVYNQAFFNLQTGSEPQFVSNSVCTNIEPANTRTAEGANPDEDLDATIRFVTPPLDIKRQITQSGGIPDFYNDNHFEDLEIYRLDNGISDYNVIRDGVYIEMSSSAVNKQEDTVDTIIVTVTSGTGDTLKVKMIETGPNTNIFRSLHPIRLSETLKGDGASCPATSEVPNFATIETNCVLQGAPDGNLKVTAEVVDDKDVTIFTLDDAALINPLGIVFDSAYNTPVAGAEVTIRNVSDGSPAENPLTQEPYEAQTTGEDGKYLFPMLYPDQDYYLDVVPPTKYTFPSKVDIETVGSTGNGTTIRTVSEASYGKDGYTKVPGDGVFSLEDIKIVDIPLDPVLTGDLTIQKTSSITEVGVGGTINYTIEADGVLDSVEHTLEYSVRTTAGAIDSDGINSAISDGRTPTSVPIDSNVSKVKVKIKQEGVLSDSGIIFGKVFVDADCNNLQNGGEWPIAGVKLYLENGTWVKTDVNGQYSLYGLESSNHVIKIDPLTVPKGLIFKPTDNRQMADPNSRLVDLKGGEFHRADFAAACPKENRDEVFDELKSRNMGQSDTMLEKAQKYDSSRTSGLGDLTTSSQADGDISNGNDQDSSSFNRTTSTERSLTRGYSVQIGQFIDKKLAETTLEALPEAIKAKAFIMPQGDFHTVRVGFGLNKKALKQTLKT